MYMYIELKAFVVTFVKYVDTNNGAVIGSINFEGCDETSRHEWSGPSIDLQSK